MLKVIDVFEVGKMMSVTLKGPCDGISNGTRLIDSDGNIIVVQSVAMTRYEDPTDIKNSTTILVASCDIHKDSELSIA